MGIEHAPEGEAYYQLYYRDYAAQNPSYKLKYYCTLAVRFAPHRESIRALDIGCAFGDVLAALPPAWERTGIDSNEFAIATAARKYEDISFVCTAGLDFPAERYDVITAFDVLEHIDDLDGALRQIHDALADDGVLIAVMPVYDGPLGGLVRLLDRDPTHVHQESRAFWRRAIGRRFHIVHSTGLFRFLIPRTRLYLHAHSTALKFLSPAIAIVARPAP